MSLVLGYDLKDRMFVCSLFYVPLENIYEDVTTVELPLSRKGYLLWDI